jgi:branched-chain amino acid transport system ATP-binding protein
MEAHNSSLLLSCEHISKSFGGNVALNDCNFTLERNMIRAIVGPNGAGKTTLFNVLTGNLKPDRGQVLFEGEVISRLKPHQIIRRGISRSFQITSIFPQLTVFENVMIPLLVKSGLHVNPFLLPHRDEGLSSEVFSILELIGLEQVSGMECRFLSHGDKKRLEIGIVLSNKPKLLLLDEPTAGMSPQETRATVNLIMRIATEYGMAILFTEHDMKVVFDISEQITVLQQGQIIADGAPEEVKNNRKVIEAYIGESAQ